MDKALDLNQSESRSDNIKIAAIFFRARTWGVYPHLKESATSIL